MKNHLAFIFSGALLVLFISCANQSKEEALVVAYLAKQTGLTEDKIKINSLEEARAYTGKDSLAVLEDSFNRAMAEKMMHLDSAIVKSERAIRYADQAKAGGFKALDPMIDETRADAEATLAEARRLKDGYSRDSVPGDLAPLHEEMERLRSMSDSTLAYVLNGTATLTREDGEENIEFSLLANKDLTAIIKEE